MPLLDIGLTLTLGGVLLLLLGDNSNEWSVFHLFILVMGVGCLFAWAALSLS